MFISNISWANRISNYPSPIKITEFKYWVVRKVMTRFCINKEENTSWHFQHLNIFPLNSGKYWNTRFYDSYLQEAYGWLSYDSQFSMISQYKGRNKQVNQELHCKMKWCEEQGVKGRTNHRYFCKGWGEVKCMEAEERASWPWMDESSRAPLAFSMPINNPRCCHFI